MEANRLSKKCKPCQIIRHNIISSVNIMGQHWVEQYSKDRLQCIAAYAYYKGYLDSFKASEPERKNLVSKALGTVKEYEEQLNAYSHTNNA